MIGTLVTVIIGLIISFSTGPNDPKLMNPNLFPCLIKKLMKTQESNALEDLLNDPSAKTVENNLDEIEALKKTRQLKDDLIASHGSRKCDPQC